MNAPRRSLASELVRRGLATDDVDALALIAAHRVLVSGAVAEKPTRRVTTAEPVTVVPPPSRFVSRAGFKLEGALDEFGVDPAGRVALDVGSSTGGFTDCLLAHGARSVLAVDVGTNQLHERLRADPRVTARERTDIRAVAGHEVPADCDLVTVDVSFISLVPLAAHLVALAGGDSDLVVLVKPQFEATRLEADRGAGVITDPSVRRRALDRTADAFERAGAGMMGVMASPIRGATGNVEFFLHLIAGRPGTPDAFGAEFTRVIGPLD